MPTLGNALLNALKSHDAREIFRHSYTVMAPMSETATNPKDAPLMREREVLFLDFLGFASAVEQWDDQRMERLIRVLAGIAEAQSSFDVKGEAQQDGGYKITSPAEITTFSDNIVVSYPAVLGDPADPGTTLVASGWAQMVRQQMRRIHRRNCSRWA
jgi:hypothetical protein